MSADRIIQKISLLQVLESRTFLDMRDILKNISDLNKNQIYYLLKKWESSGIVEKKGEDKVLPGGIQFKFKLSAEGRDLLRELSSEIFNKVKSLVKSKNKKSEKKIVENFTKIVKREIKEGLQEKLVNFEKAQIEEISNDISESIKNRLDMELDQY